MNTDNNSHTSIVSTSALPMLKDWLRSTLEYLEAVFPNKILSGMFTGVSQNEIRFKWFLA